MYKAIQDIGNAPGLRGNRQNRLEEEEAQRVQSVLKLTDAEIDNITRFERGSALIVTNSNNVTVDMRCSEEEKDLITTDRDELRRIVERKMQNQTETEES